SCGPHFADGVVRRIGRSGFGCKRRGAGSGRGGVVVVAVAAAVLGVGRFAEVFEDLTGAALCGAAVAHDGGELGAVGETAGLVVEELVVQRHGGDVGDEPFPFAAAVLADGAEALHERENDARLAASGGGAIGDVVQRDALAGRARVHDARHV